ncbi:ATP-binding protein [Alkalimonas collagenimarina]|uniref:histidine kinase n=1 Tax=Alkalimonas collagenimarina TaxID=400390 RepID=A0ABT9GXX5_9GAMM|nr:ATP-binding protein [Alkalimonas collagenimarina]MDP4535906.1 ATP-binding protein [Alkalimonas collagenimarina]
MHTARTLFSIQDTPLAESSQVTDFSRYLNIQADPSDRMQHLVSMLPVGVVVLDGRGYVSDANPVALEMLGEPLTGQRWLDVITRSFRPRSDDGMEVSLHNGRRVKLAISAMNPEPGQLIVLTDLTETRQLQSRLAHMQRLSTLGKMMATLAHQIRTPLSSAMLYAENLNNQRLNESAKDLFQQKLVSRLQDLEQQVNDMLLFARSGSEASVAEVSISSLLQEVESGIEAQLEPLQARLHLQVTEPDLRLWANKSSLAGAIQNLLHNSLQIIGTGAELMICCQRHPQHPDCLEIQVRDNGPGIPEHLQHQVFEPFFTTRSQGTGLGLAVVQAVVNAHKGEVHCQNQEGGGACFTLQLPMHTESQPRQENANGSH